MRAEYTLHATCVQHDLKDIYLKLEAQNQNRNCLGHQYRTSEEVDELRGKQRGTGKLGGLWCGLVQCSKPEPGAGVEG